MIEKVLIEKVIRKLERAYTRRLRRDVFWAEVDCAARFLCERDIRDGEEMFVPETWFYDIVLSMLRGSDVVLDVGAGDLRFALLASRKVRKIYAVEVDPKIMSSALRIISYDLPRNVIPICADARDVALPSDVTVITCLMIHRSWTFPLEWLSKRIIYTKEHGIFVWDPATRSYR